VTRRLDPCWLLRAVALAVTLAAAGVPLAGVVRDLEGAVRAVGRL
jgi:hypothetical protein